jgi:hypothetical protein
MQSNLIDDISKLTGDDASGIQDTISKLSLDELYQLMDLVGQNDVLGVKQMLAAYTTTPEPMATESINLAIVCKQANIYESVLNWLEDNSIPHTFRPGNTLIVSCHNNAQADYLVKMVESASKPKKKVKEDKPMSDKIKIPGQKPFNPLTKELTKSQYKAQVTPTKKGKLNKMASKHKAKGLDEAFGSVGFWVDNSKAYDIILESFGKSITFDGSALDTDVQTWKRIEESLITGGYKPGTDFGRNNMTKKVKEGVLGMTQMPGLRRMMELAGMPADQINQIGADASLPVTTSIASPATDAMDSVMGADDADLGIDDMAIDGDDLDDVGLDDPAMAGDFADADAVDGMDDMDMDMDLDTVDMPVTGSDASPAYTLISDALASIQGSLPDVKISEYKTLIQRLEELTNQLRQVGQSYLGE